MAALTGNKMQIIMIFLVLLGALAALTHEWFGAFLAWGLAANGAFRAYGESDKGYHIRLGLSDLAQALRNKNSSQL